MGKCIGHLIQEDLQMSNKHMKRYLHFIYHQENSVCNNNDITTHLLEFQKSKILTEEVEQ